MDDILGLMYILIISLGVFAFLIATAVVSWTSYLRIKRVEEDLKSIRRRLGREQGDKVVAFEETKVESPLPVPVRKEITLARKEPVRKTVVATSQEGRNIEKQFGTQLTVWVGAIALALAGFFLVKYTVEQGILTPEVRIMVGLIFGTGLMGLGWMILGKWNFANSERIAQALTGAGIAINYGCLFAAHSLYGMMGAQMAFFTMAILTGVAVGLSLKHGTPIALLGLVGGFLTPALIGSTDVNVVLIFTYLYLLFVGFMLVSRKEQWWVLSILAQVGAFLWTGYWLSFKYLPGDSVWIGVFLIAIMVTNVALSYGVRETRSRWVQWFNYLGIMGAVLLMGFVSSVAEYGVQEWVLYGLLSAAAIVMATVDKDRYKIAPLAAFVVSVVLFYNWETQDVGNYAWTIGSFGVLFGLSSLVLIFFQKQSAFDWAILLGGTLLVYYFLAEDFVSFQGHEVGKYFWGILGGGMSLLMAGLFVKEYREDEREPMLSVYSIFGVAILTYALYLELYWEYFPLACAVEILGVVLLGRWIQLKVADWIGGGLMLLVAAWVLPYALDPIFDWIRKPEADLVFYILPALVIVGARFYTDAKKTVYLGALEIFGMLSLTIGSYYMIRKGFHPGEVLGWKNYAKFFERGVITNAFLVLSGITIGLGRHYKISRVVGMGVALGGVCFFRIVAFDGISFNLLWTKDSVGTMVLLNSLSVIFGLMLALVLATRSLLIPRKWEGTRGVYGVAGLVLSFWLVTLWIRQYFHGEFLDDGVLGKAEIYTYSIGWLLMGLGLMGIGIYLKDKMTRVASLVVMLLVIGKVFLYDASELDGLFRVFAFLGLGVSLIGLSFFYQKFVFKKQ